MFALTLPSKTDAVFIMKTILHTVQTHSHMHVHLSIGIPIYNILTYNTYTQVHVGISRINKCGKGIMLNRKRSWHDKYVVVDKNDVVIIIFFVFTVYGLYRQCDIIV